MGFLVYAPYKTGESHILLRMKFSVWFIVWVGYEVETFWNT